MQNVSLRDAGPIVRDMIAAIVREQAMLGEIDGATGDGDHGINMAKGFRLASERLPADGFDFDEGLRIVGDTLLGDIGGSMGPLYGTFFTEMADALATAQTIDRSSFEAMLEAGVASVVDIGGAKLGDKSLVDVLLPALSAFAEAAAGEQDFLDCLENMKRASEQGFQSTRHLVARIGRAARLGERSRGSLDAGAASCNLLLTTIADGLTQRLQIG